MTSETKNTIELSDILAIEIECPVCHTRTSRPLKPSGNIVPSACRSGLCFNNPFVIQASQLQNLVDLLGRYAHPQGNPGLVLRFELRPVKKPTP